MSDNQHYVNLQPAYLIGYAPAALYPNVVAVTAILASPFWRALAGSEQVTDRDRFFERINTEVAEGNRPTGPHDPLRIWRNLTDRPVDLTGMPNQPGHGRPPKACRTS